MNHGNDSEAANLSKIEASVVRYQMKRSEEMEIRWGRAPSLYFRSLTLKVCMNCLPSRQMQRRIWSSKIGLQKAISTKQQAEYLKSFRMVELRNSLLPVHLALQPVSGRSTVS